MTSYVENTGKYCHDKSSSFGDDGKISPGCWEMAQHPRTKKTKLFLQLATFGHVSSNIPGICSYTTFSSSTYSHLQAYYIYMYIICLFLSLSVILCIFHIQTTQGSTSHIGGFLKLGYPQIIQVIN